MNQNQIKKLSWTGKDLRIRVAPNLYVSVRRSSKTYLFRAQVNGHTVIKTLGPVDYISLKEAKQRAFELRYRRHDSYTLEQAANDYLDDCTLKRLEPVKYHIGYIVKAIGHIRLTDLSRGDITAFIRKYRKQSPSMARLLLIRTKMIIGHAISEGFLDTENVAAGIDISIAKYNPPPRDRVLSDEEIIQMWTWKDNNARLLRFLLLTGCRYGESQSGVINGDTFNIEDTKQGKPHWCYLTELAKEQLPIHKVSNHSISVYLRRKGNGWRCHDTRRTFETVSASMGVNPWDIERTIGHALPTSMMAVYQQHDYSAERAACFEAVSEYVRRLIE